jgi:hypothetical protein
MILLSSLSGVIQACGLAGVARTADLGIDARPQSFNPYYIVPIAEKRDDYLLLVLPELPQWSLPLRLDPVFTEGFLDKSMTLISAPAARIIT